MKNSFLPIKLIDLIPNMLLGFDLFLFFPENDKFIKYISKDDLVDDEIIMRMKTRRIYELFISREDMTLYQKYLARSLKYYFSNSMRNKEESTQKIKQVAKNVFENINLSISQDGTGDWCRDVIGLTNVIVEELSGNDINGFKDRLSELINGNNTLEDHSLVVSILSVVFGMALGIYHGRTLSELAVGGLLHDVGLLKIPNQVVIKYLHNEQLSSEELSQLIKHPQFGVDLVKSNMDTPIITEKVIKIILEHHENIHGTGFPRGISNLKQSFLAKIVATADNVAKDIVNNESHDLIFSMHQCVKDENPFDHDLLKQIMKVIKT